MVSPFDSAWSILKALSRDDLRHAARTGGIPMTEARRQAYEDEGKKLSTGGGFRTMPDTEAQRMIAEQHRMRQGPFDSGDMRDANDIEIAGASIEDPSFAERYDPEPEIDPELSQFQTGDTPSNPFERAIHSITQRRRQKAYEQHLLQQQRQRMAQAQRPQMQRGGRRPGEGKNAYRNRMKRQQGRRR